MSWLAVSAGNFDVGRRVVPGVVTRTVLGAAVAGLVGALAACSGGGAETGVPANPGGALISGIHRDSVFRGAELAEPYRMPDITLTADNGAPFNLVTDTAYPVTLVFYGYSNCPDVCPLVLSELASAYAQLPGPVRANTQVLFITTDPARDTGDVLRGYLSRYNPSFVGLTGKLASIRAAASDMGVPIKGVKRLPSGGYDVGHGAEVIAFRDNLAPVIWTEGTPVSDMVSDIEELAR